MFARALIPVTVMLILVSACAPVQPATQVDSISAIKVELAPILKVMLGNTTVDQLALIEYTQAACANVEGLGAPPRCPEGVSEGTPVQVFPILGAEGSFIKPDEMEQFLVSSSLNKLYAVSRVTNNPNLEPYYPLGEYAMLFERHSGHDPVTLRVQAGKIVRMNFHMGISAADLLKEVPVEQVLLSPQEAETWMQAAK